MTPDVIVQDVALGYEDYLYRTPIKFGGVVLDRVTLLNVTLTVETQSGQVVHGRGSMPLGNVWAWPSRTLSYAHTLSAMKQAAEGVAMIYRRSRSWGHPVELTHTLEPEWFRSARPEGLPEPMPPLAVYVVASSFDAALHDAYGRSLGLNCYHTYGPEFLGHDLGRYLGPEFAGESLDRYIRTAPQTRMPLYHLVGALDPLTPEDVVTPVGDGLPETLAEWVTTDGLTHLKIKLNGDDLVWDVERVLRVDAVTATVQQARDVGVWWYSLDFNERCQSVEYLLEFLRQVRDRNPRAYDRIQYVEQPTARDLKANPHNAMHEAARLKPVVIDESLLDLETLTLAQELGYSGVAFKACKGQTQSLLMAAAAQKRNLFRCVQDLTCVGASLIHSAGLAAHIPGVAAIESNGRQYCPAANRDWVERFPGVLTTRDGTMNTGLLTGAGLGAG